MNELVKSKGMIGFILFIIGISCFNVVKTNNEMKIDKGSNTLIVLNDK